MKGSIASFLVLASLSFGGGAFAENEEVLAAVKDLPGATPAGLQAVTYLSQQAVSTARQVKNVQAFSEAVIDSYDFYHSYVCYRGAKALPVELLGSWEFADRIETLIPYWSPYDQQAIDDIKELARQAREKTGVKYESVRLPVAWLDRLAAGEEVETKDFSSVYPQVVQLLSNAQMQIAVTHSRGRFEYDDEADGNVWVTSRYETTGKLATAGDMPFSQPLTSMGLMIKEFKQRDTDTGMESVASSERPFVAVKAGTLKLLPKQGPEKTRKWLVKGLEQAGYPLERLQSMVPRVKGEKPSDMISCSGEAANGAVKRKKK